MTTADEGSFETLSKIHGFASTAWRQHAQSAMEYVLENESARAAFKSFLSSEYNEHHVEFWEDLQRHEVASGTDSECITDAPTLHQLFCKYVVQGGELSLNVSYQVAQEQDHTRALQKAKVEVLQLLALDALPRFMRSQYCVEFMLAAAPADTAADTAAGDGGSWLSGGGSAENWTGFTTLYQRTHNQKPGKGSPRYAKGDWMATLVRVADTLPTCIVVSDMRAPDTPVIYVNPAFQKMSGYNFSESTSRNCRFLQGDDTEPEVITKMQVSMRAKRQFHVVITNYRKSGEKFKQLLSMKPVLDMEGKLVFYVGVQYELHRDSMAQATLRQHDEMLRFLPSSIPTTVPHLPCDDLPPAPGEHAPLSERKTLAAAQSAAAANRTDTSSVRSTAARETASSVES
jgi:PAS domain S-box-containing protein